VCSGSVWLGCRGVKGSALVSPGFESGVFALGARREREIFDWAPGDPSVCFKHVPALWSVAGISRV
jgi:hypothetical protein